MLLIGEGIGAKQRIVEALNESFQDSDHDSEGEVTDTEVNKDYFFNTNEANESLVKKISSTHRNEPSQISSIGMSSIGTAPPQLKINTSSFLDMS